MSSFGESLKNTIVNSLTTQIILKISFRWNKDLNVKHGMLKYKDDHCSLWEVTYGTDDDKPKTIFDTPRNAVNIVFNTPDAIQKTREGERLNEADVVFYCY